MDDRSWGRVEEALASDHTLVVITGPGHGASSDPGRRYTMDECADAARTVLDSLDFTGPVDWLGNAWGGHVGLLFAARWPSRCRTLVTMGTPIQALSLRAQIQTRFLLAAYRLLGPARLIRKGVADVLLSPATRAHDPDAVHLVHDCIASADRKGLRNAVTSISLRRADATPLLQRIPVPTLFITGADHSGWTPDQAKAASRRLPEGSAAVVAHAAYLTPYERPEETARLIRDFWATNTARLQTKSP
jgi:pimeloyl-ACP methyl ester carboxylesterase